MIAGQGDAAPSRTAARSSDKGACERCLRRSWLLGLLSARLEYRSRGDGRLVELLTLPDDQLLCAVGGGRVSDLRDRHAQFHARQVRAAAGVQSVCRHDRRYPHMLAGEIAPRMLHVAGGVETLCRLAAAPTVAIVGTARASDYGLQMARSLARGLSASGVTVVTSLSDGIAAAAHEGASELAAPSLGVLGGGVDVAFPARRRSLYEHVRLRGCLVSELPCGLTARRWALRAAERIIAGLAALTVVVEADDSPGDLAGARTAQALAKPIAAFPGRVTSPFSRGTHALLRHGASLVRGPSDVLDLLCAQESRRFDAARPAAALSPLLLSTLELVGAGLDTPDRLMNAGGNDARETLLALAELELLGLLARGAGGRYVPRHSLAER